jgi:carboxyl-terminal processing protease
MSFIMNITIMSFIARKFSRKNRIPRHRNKRISIIVALLPLLTILSACSIDSPKVVTPTPSRAERDMTRNYVPPTITPMPPSPTNTPRPSVPPVASSIRPAKTEVLQRSFQNLLNLYFFPLESGSLYEMGLRGIKDTLKANGINDPQVPIPDFTGDPAKDWNIFLQAYTVTLEKYQGQVPEETLAYGAIQAATGSVSECRTGFIRPSEANDFLQNVAGTAPVVGLGIVVVTPEGGEGLYISRVVPGSPAEKAGLKLGDAIRGVDGQNIVGLDLGQASRLLVGGEKPTPGTQVALDVRRAITAKDEKITITRGSTIPQLFERQVYGNIGYLRINSFPNRTQTGIADLNRELDNNLRELNNQNIKGLVIDLRGVRFGNYSTVRNFLSRFIQDNGILLLAGRNDQGKYSPLPMNSVQGVTPLNKPVAVLVDGTTAAEAELFAYSLQFKKAGRIFGAPSAGCLVGSDIVRLPDNSMLNVAVFRVVTDLNQPDSLVIRVAPDVEVGPDIKMLEQGKDAVLEKALEYIRSA